jgi:hypothetical protein
MREFQDFPSASLGWMMYIGMAVAKMWDTEWEVMEQREQSDARIDSAESRQNSTEGQIYSKIEDLYAYMRDKRGYDQMDEYISEEVNGYVACLHQLYLMGAAVQLKRMGYHMTKMN